MKEYHLIDLITGESHGGFATLNGARQYALEEGLRCWQILKASYGLKRTTAQIKSCLVATTSGCCAAADTKIATTSGCSAAAADATRGTAANFPD
jgi:hypothetical protein